MPKVFDSGTKKNNSQHKNRLAVYRDMNYISELENCSLCEWQCEVNRLKGELGVCRIKMPKAASAMLHSAPPQSYTVFLNGCNFRCLGCQNWNIAHFPDTDETLRGHVEPKRLANFYPFSELGNNTENYGFSELGHLGSGTTFSTQLISDFFLDLYRTKNRTV